VNQSVRVGIVGKLAIVHRSKFTALRENASSSGVLIQALPFAPR
jgi:hypothetical protein